MSLLWTMMMITGIVSAVIEKKPERLLLAIVEGGSDSVQYLLSLVGIMAFWSGIYTVIEKTGVLTTLAKSIARPMFKRVFREPLGEEEEEAIFACIMANLLGLGNAATVWGLKAMSKLKRNDRLTPNMATFLIILSSGLTVFPTTIINLRSSMHSKEATVIWFPALLVSLTVTVFAIVLDKVWGQKE